MELPIQVELGARPRAGWASSFRHSCLARQARQRDQDHRACAVHRRSEPPLELRATAALSGYLFDELAPSGGGASAAAGGYQYVYVLASSAPERRNPPGAAPPARRRCAGCGERVSRLSESILRSSGTSEYYM